MTAKRNKPRRWAPSGRVRPPSPALVLAGLALLVASSGAAYSAGQARHFPRLNGVDIINNSLTGKDVRNRSLTRKDLAASALPRRGPAGPTGPGGPQGLPGPKGNAGDPGAIAYGMIRFDGVVSRATPNVTSTWNAASLHYEITIAGQTYHFANYATVVSPVDSALMGSTTSSAGKLIVRFRNTAGTPVQTPAGFSFVTYAP